MRIRWFLPLIAAMAAACSSAVYPIDVIIVEGISQQAASEYLYFRVAEASGCAGVRIRSKGTRRILSFIRSSSDVEVDSVAVLSEDVTWEGMLRVEIPLEESLLEKGGEMTIAFEGGGRAEDYVTFSYPARARSDEPRQTDGPVGRR